MIRAKATDPDGKPIIFLGLSRENITRLVAGQPIRVVGDSVGVPSLAAITIVFGETEKQILQDMRDAGFQLPPVSDWHPE